METVVTHHDKVVSGSNPPSESRRWTASMLEIQALGNVAGGGSCGFQ